MDSSQRAAELRALADQHDTIGVLEDELAAALGAYRSDPNERTKAEYTKASSALRGARGELRGSNLLVASGEPGSVTIGAAVTNGRA